MNTYVISGTYRLWEKTTSPRPEPFSRTILAETVEQAIQMVHATYRDAVITTVVTRDQDVLSPKPTIEELQTEVEKLRLELEAFRSIVFTVESIHEMVLSKVQGVTIEVKQDDKVRQHLNLAVGDHFSLNLL